MFSKAVLADRKTKGDATNICANITAKVLPGKVKPRPLSTGPKRPMGAKTKSRATPATAGGRTIGIFINVSIIAFPGKFLVARR